MKYRGGRGQLAAGRAHRSRSTDLHALGQDGFDIHGNHRACGQVAARLRRTGKVGRKLDEHAVRFHRPHHAAYGFAGEKGRRSAPSSKRLPMGKRNAPRVWSTAHDCIDVLSHPEPVVRMENAGNRKVLYADPARPRRGRYLRTRRTAPGGSCGGDRRPAGRCEQMVTPAAGRSCGKARRSGSAVLSSSSVMTKQVGLPTRGTGWRFHGVPLSATPARSMSAA